MSEPRADAPGWLASSRRILSIVVIFALLGPPIGAIVLFSAIAVMSFGISDPKGTAAVILFALIYGIIFSYFIGTVPAALAGLAVGLWQTFIGRVPWFVALAIGVVAGLGLAAFSGEAPSTLDDNAIDWYRPLLVLVCLVPTMLCWAIVRSWYCPVASPPTPIAEAGA
jgi:hypothetical protein